MSYFINLFSPETAEAFISHGGTISGFQQSQRRVAERLKPGDRFACYVTRISRWIGILEIDDGPFEESTPIFRETDDPFVIRFRVTPIIWLDLEYAVPIHEAFVWNELSFTKGHSKSSSSWTGKLRSSLTELPATDGEFLERILLEQKTDQRLFEFTESDRKKLKPPKVRTRTGEEVTVSVPEDDTDESLIEPSDQLPRESVRIQALLARVGAEMGYSIWIPRADRSRVQAAIPPETDLTMLERLPLNYDDTTLSTVEQIDVIWLRGRSVVRAFEVEHTTSVYSGILRMADLMALQPNLDIKAHIVAPVDRRDKVLQELKRPVFSLLEKGPLATYCSYIPYDEVERLSEEKFLSHMTDSVLEELAEYAE